MAAEIIKNAASTTMTSAEIAAELVTTITRPPKSAGEIAAETDAKVNAYLGPLFRYTNDFLPKDKSEIPVFVLTRTEDNGAGERQPDGYNTLCGAIKRYINIAGFKSGECNIISADDEALYGWVAANYSAGNFTKQTPTTGFLDVGGDSVQIAFSPEPVDCKEYKGPLTMIQVGDREFRVFTRVWPSLGIHAVRQRHDKDTLSNLGFPDEQFLLPFGNYRKALPIGYCNFYGCQTAILSFIRCKHANCVEGNRCVASGNGCLMKDAPLIGSKPFIGASPFWRSTNEMCDPGEGGFEEDEYKLDYFSRDNVDHIDQVRAMMSQKHPPGWEVPYKNNLFNAGSLISIMHYGLGIQNTGRYRFGDIQDAVKSEVSGEASDVPFAAIDTNWTLGWVILYATGGSPEILGSRSWAKKVSLWGGFGLKSAAGWG